MTIDLQTIVDKISNDLSLDPGVPIDGNTELLMSGLVDSLGIVGLLAWLEEQIGVLIDPGLVTLENFEHPIAIQAFCSDVVATNKSSA